MQTRARWKTFPEEGGPAKPRSWLISTGRFKAIDKLRRRSVYDRSLAAIAAELEDDASVDPDWDVGEGVADDRLRLVFTCCHPALSPDAQVALTLRAVCGLTTEEIARAFLVRAPTLARRIVRAKAKIRDAGIPYEVPEQPDLPAVLRVVYLPVGGARCGSRNSRSDGVRWTPSR